MDFAMSLRREYRRTTRRKKRRLNRSTDPSTGPGCSAVHDERSTDLTPKSYRTITRSPPIPSRAVRRSKQYQNINALRVVSPSLRGHPQMSRFFHQNLFGIFQPRPFYQRQSSYLSRQERRCYERAHTSLKHPSIRR